jgi:hypothetical protein
VFRGSLICSPAGGGRPPFVATMVAVAWRNVIMALFAS